MNQNLIDKLNLLLNELNSKQKIEVAQNLKICFSENSEIGRLFRTTDLNYLLNMPTSSVCKFLEKNLTQKISYQLLDNEIKNCLIVIMIDGILLHYVANNDISGSKKAKLDEESMVWHDVRFTQSANQVLQSNIMMELVG